MGLKKSFDDFDEHIHPCFPHHYQDAEYCQYLKRFSSAFTFSQLLPIPSLHKQGEKVNLVFIIID